jgi:hypothetical protein
MDIPSILSGGLRGTVNADPSYPITQHLEDIPGGSEGVKCCLAKRLCVES